MRRFIYKIKINGIDYDITKIADSSSFSVVAPLCSTDKKSGNGTASVNIKGGANPTFYQTFMGFLLNAQQTKTLGDCLVTIKDNILNKCVHRGWLNTDEFTISSAHFPDSLNLASRDKMQLLDTKIKANRYWEGASRNQIVQDLLGELATQTGQTVTYLSTELTDSETVDNWCVAEGKEQTYREVIDTLLYEAVGYVLWYDPDSDGFRIKNIPTNYDPLNTYRTVTYRVENKLVTQSSVYEHDGILLSYPTITERPNTNIFNEGIDSSIDDGGTVTGEEVLSGDYFPKDGDVKEIYQEYSVPDRAYLSGESRLQNNDLKLLYAKNVSYSLSSKPQLSLAPAIPAINWNGTPQYFPDRARILFRNDNANKANVTTFSLTGTAIYISAQNKITVPSLCTNPEEYTVQSITDGAKAKLFADWFYNSKRYGCTTSKWCEPEGYSTLGEIVLVRHKDTGVEMPHVIVQITDSCAGGQSGDIRLKEVVAISLYGWQSTLSQTVPQVNKPSTTKVDNARWYSGTILTGQTTCRGVAGNYGDYYLNSDTGDIYRCIESGTENTALWQWVMNNMGEDADVSKYRYQLQYGLSTSPHEFVYPDGLWGYAENANYGYDDDDEYGFKNVGGWSDNYDNWYKGLYVWSRMKVTDENGDVTYEDPIYCKEITDSLINGCTFDVLFVDSDGDGNTQTWEKNRASSDTITITFQLISRRYRTVDDFHSALTFLSLTPYKTSIPYESVNLINAVPTKQFDTTSRTALLTYSYSFSKSADYDSLVINAKISDQYLNEDETTYSIDTDGTNSMTAVDVTVENVFIGLFDSDLLAEAELTNQYGGVIEGYTYAISDDTSPNYLALKTYTEGRGWVLLSDANFDDARVSDICSKAQKCVLGQVQQGSVTASDFAYFNVLIANVITADFIGSKQIRVKPDADGNAGMIYGGDVDLTKPVGQKTTGYGFYFDSNGNGEVSNFKVRGESVIEGDSVVKGLINNVDENGDVVFSTNKDSGKSYTMRAKKVDGTDTPVAFSNEEWQTRLLTATANFTANHLYSVTGYVTGTINGTYGQHTLSGFKRVTSVSSTPYIISDEPERRNVAETKIVWENNSGIILRVSMIHIVANSSWNIFGTRDWGDTRVRILNSDNTVYRDFGLNDDSGGYYYNVDIPKGAKVEAYWQESTKYIHDAEKGKIDIQINDSVNWSVGSWLIDQYGYKSKIEDCIPSSGYGTSPQKFYCYTVTDEIAFSPSATFPTGVAKLYDNFTWTTSPQDSGGNPPTSTITTVIIDNTSSFTYRGTSYSIASVSFSATTLSITDTQGNIYTLSSGYQPAFDAYIKTAGDFLGARSQSMMPVYKNGALVGTGYVGSTTEPWFQMYADTITPTSKRERKTNIEDYNGKALPILLETQIKSFNYKSEIGKERCYTHYGFIADDTAEELATPYKDVMETGNCIGLLIKAIQELYAKIEELEGGKK